MLYFLTWKFLLSILTYEISQRNKYLKTRNLIRFLIKQNDDYHFSLYKKFILKLMLILIKGVQQKITAKNLQQKTLTAKMYSTKITVKNVEQTTWMHCGMMCSKLLWISVSIVFVTGCIFFSSLWLAYDSHCSYGGMVVVIVRVVKAKAVPPTKQGCH